MVTPGTCLFRPGRVARQRTELSEVISRWVGHEYFARVTSIDGTPVTNEKQYVNPASQTESGRRVEMCHLDVTLSTRRPKVGP
jgi:hypothetical protein